MHDATRMHTASLFAAGLIQYGSRAIFQETDFMQFPATSPMPVGFLPKSQLAGRALRARCAKAFAIVRLAPRATQPGGASQHGHWHSWGHSTRRFPMITRRSISPRALAALTAGL